MFKKPVWSAIETLLLYYSGHIYNWSSLQLRETNKVDNATDYLEKG